ncbi:MAG: aldehyde ferredoxin oxidoreductase [Nitrospinota bacterium]|nr:MAG: aldehyde ferredoxin oxidoreductase [Nitrospinota bacterium]
MPYGFNGKILRVDLTEGKTWTEELPESIYRRYLGGGALATYYLLKELKPGVDPLGPENMLILMCSVITGMNMSGANRFSAVAKSPLTGGYGEAEASGYWGPELKFAGFDGIVIQGKAPQPVYLWVHDGQAEIRDASKAWGKLAGEAEEIIKADVGVKGVRLLQTGVAGENLVRYAALVNELKHFNGRCGMGAVMGSKNLKGIAVRGKNKPQPADKEAMFTVYKWFKEHYDRENDPMHDMGTSRGVPSLDQDGILPTRNFREGSFEFAREISGKTMKETILVNRGTCYGCSVACKREVKVEELGVDPRYGGPEYETIAANGSLLGIGNLKSIALANQLLGQYVLDSISTGMAIAFAMECYENGILTKEDTGGLELNFGNEEAAIKLIEMIGRREGIGDILAEGVKRAAEKIGKGAEKFALHVKGQELPMHEPRGKRSLAIAYATSPTGADHMEAPHDPFYEAFGHEEMNPLSPLGLVEPVDRLDLGPKKVKAFYYCQAVWSLYNSVGMCDFDGVPIGHVRLEKLVEFVRSVTGWNTSLWELLKVGERANTMARIFNFREGFTKADDTLPDRMFEGLQSGALKGKKLDRKEFAEALRLYYQMAGWDPDTGYPTRAKLAELDLDWLAPEQIATSAAD